MIPVNIKNVEFVTNDILKLNENVNCHFIDCKCNKNKK